jgi:hypothetical protein
LTVYISPGFFSHAKYAKISENTFLSWILAQILLKFMPKKFSKNVCQIFQEEKKIGGGGRETV